MCQYNIFIISPTPFTTRSNKQNIDTIKVMSVLKPFSKNSIHSVLKPFLLRAFLKHKAQILFLKTNVKMCFGVRIKIINKTTIYETVAAV